MHVIQQKLLRLVDTYNLGTMALRDIGKILDCDHPQIIKHHLEQLEKKGIIKWDRDTKIISKAQDSVSVNTDFVILPVVGAANCGVASIFADECVEGHIKVSTSLLGNRKDVFAVSAVGHSMNKANINGKNIENGDYVIIDASDKNIRSGDYVLSIIDDTANIKKIQIDAEHNQIALYSESTFIYPPIFIDMNEASRFIVNGKIIQVIKC